MQKCILFFLLLVFLVVPVLYCSAEEALHDYLGGSLLAQNDPQAVEWTWDEFHNILTDISAKNIYVSDDTIAQIKNRKNPNKETIEKSAVLRILMEGELGTYSTWSIEEKHRFDELLVAYGLMQYPIAVLPGENDIGQEEAKAAAKAHIQNVYNIPEEKVKNYMVNAFFRLLTEPTDTEDKQAPYWIFTFMTPEGEEMYWVTLTTKGDVHIGINLKSYLEQIQAEKGMFHFWPLEEKVELSKKMQTMVEEQLAQGYAVFPMAQTIADTKFRLPDEKDITEETAVSLAVQAVKKAQGFQDGWENGYNIGRSLLDDEEGKGIWRITFWIKDRSSSSTYRRGRVQLDAASGEVLSCDADGATFDTSIPYEEMI